MRLHDPHIGTSLVMPFFKDIKDFKDLRRRSRASFRTTDSSSGSNGTVPTAKSTSTLDSSYGAITPPKLNGINGSTPNLASIKSPETSPPPIPSSRPPPIPSYSNRNSVIVSSAQGFSPFGLTYFYSLFTTADCAIGSHSIRLEQYDENSCPGD